MRDVNRHADVGVRRSVKGIVNLLCENLRRTLKGKYQNIDAIKQLPKFMELKLKVVA